MASPKDRIPTTKGIAKKFGRWGELAYLVTHPKEHPVRVTFFAVLVVVGAIFAAWLAKAGIEKLGHTTNINEPTAPVYKTDTGDIKVYPIIPPSPHQSPIHDDGMRLVAALSEFGHWCQTNGLPAYNDEERFDAADYVHWIIQVRDELFMHNRHSDSLDDAAQKLGQQGAHGIFVNTTNTSAAIVFGIRDEIKRLAEPLHE